MAKSTSKTRKPTAVVRRRVVTMDLQSTAMVLAKVSAALEGAAVTETARPTLALSRKTFVELQDLIKSVPRLRDDPALAKMRDCDPDDPFDICF